MNQVFTSSRVAVSGSMRRLWGSLLLVMLFATSAFAQRTVSGTVIDELGEPLPGVNIRIEGTGSGTTTDLDGKYSLQVDDGNILVYSYIGYLAQNVTVGARAVIDITMQPDLAQLEEVVVVGYTSKREADITGAVTVVTSEDINMVNAASFGQKLSGQAAGVTTSTSGQPGEGTNIRIRGFSSFTNNDPLIIVDGVPVQDKFNTSINPNDIESMQVLKDASAASIYGSRANNGVIIITTKQGKAGQLQVSYNGKVGLQVPVGGYDDILMQDPQEWADFVYQGHANAGITPDTYYPLYGTDASNPVLPDYVFPAGATGIDESTYSYPDNLIMRANQAGTDWWNEVFNPALITDHNIGLSGGTENATFSVSANYFNQEGTMMHTYFERFSARANSKFTKGWFTFGENFQFARSESVGQNGFAQDEQNVMTNIIKMPTLVPVLDVGGNFAGAKANGLGNGNNPVALQERNKDNIFQGYRVLGNFYGEVEPIKGLKARTSFGIDATNNHSLNFTFPNFEASEPTNVNGFGENWDRFYNWTWTNTLTYSATFGDNNINVLVGHEAVKNSYRGIFGGISQLFSEDVNGRYVNLALGNVDSRAVSSYGSFSTLLSYFGKIDYAYQDLLYADFTIRRDGSSNFGPNNRFGVFPAGSVGFRLSSLGFMQGVSAIDNLKIRVGYGITGNQAIGGLNNFNQYGGGPAVSSYDITGSNGSTVSGFALVQRGNADTRWEENRAINVGLDAGFLDGTLNLALDVYQNNVDGLLFNAALPGTAGGAAPPFRNIASMTTSGIDANVGYNNTFGNLGFSADLNVTRYVNTINAIDGNASFFSGSGIDSRIGELTRNVVGNPISTFFGYTVEGTFADQADVDAHATQDGAAPGRLKFSDLNGDGVINDDDRGIIGNPHPDFTMGLNLGFDIAGFDFTAFLFASVGNEIYNYNRLFTDFSQFNSNVAADRLTNAWQPGDTDAKYTIPDVSDSFSRTSSSYYVEDGSFLRARTIEAGYTFPSGVTDALNMSSLRFYIQGQNLFTITNYTGIDPELSNVNISDSGQNDLWQGFDFGNYPSSQMFLIGVSANF